VELEQEALAAIERGDGAAATGALAKIREQGATLVHLEAAARALPAR
jgi:hypothetical protein